VILCSRYSKRGIAYKIITGKKKYSLYISLSYPCDITNIPLNSRKLSFARFLLFFTNILVTYIINEAKRLEEHKAATEELLSTRREALYIV
jgi:hypothetical protein